MGARAIRAPRGWMGYSWPIPHPGHVGVVLQAVPDLDALLVEGGDPLHRPGPLDRGRGRQPGRILDLGAQGLRDGVDRGADPVGRGLVVAGAGAAGHLVADAIGGGGGPAGPVVGRVPERDPMRLDPEIHLVIAVLQAPEPEYGPAVDVPLGDQLPLDLGSVWPSYSVPAGIRTASLSSMARRAVAFSMAANPPWEWVRVRSSIIMPSIYPIGGDSTITFCPMGKKIVAIPTPLGYLTPRCNPPPAGIAGTHSQGGAQ